MKKLIVLLLASCYLLIISGCGSTDTSDSTADNPLYYTYSASSFALEVPNDWETISQFTSDYPQNTLVAFRNNLKDLSFIANVNIVANAVNKGMNNGDYALEMLQTHSENLIDYRLIEKQEIEILINEQSTPTYLNYFEGRNSVDSDILEFVQVYGVNNQIGYIVTATFLPEEDNFIVENAVHVVKSLELK
ncbi:hypothetical protein COW94_03655 [Candidatus Peregrinibacteria bacterium CG22_combo_CG10-13_8_21_14_all_44_10]|nr:hypothetical protein [Candidatus Peregrinibacteria bacterium]PIP66083.1 MAG: hypothetical protein COW94_03655 [Candidatus Peregrinibacteria bacterium CG22_combo_CG10-13_8_21_14_all_44_10]PJB88483.1 MAG: hypothetical protein CO082_04265 [Candidatus Peregrinibacteria bacterium CG_4_9_14_0_8_um_filter_44_15]